MNQDLLLQLLQRLDEPAAWLLLAIRPNRVPSATLASGDRNASG